MVSSRIAFFRRLYTKVPKSLNEATLAEAKQKAVSVALWEQKLTTFEDRSKFSEKIFLAPAVGLEPTTQWLTATCSAS